MDSFSAIDLTIAKMSNLKRRGMYRKRCLNSSSNSTASTVSDLEDRVIMLCGDNPNKNSFDSGRGSYSPGAHFSRGSQNKGHKSGSEASHHPPEQRQTVIQTGLLCDRQSRQLSKHLDSCLN